MAFLSLFSINDLANYETKDLTAELIHNCHT